MKKSVKSYIILMVIVGLFFCSWLAVTLLQSHNMISSQRAYANNDMGERFDVYVSELNDYFGEYDITMEYEEDAKMPKEIGGVSIDGKYEMYRKYHLSDGGYLHIFLKTNEDKSQDKIRFFVETTTYETAIDIASDLQSKDYVIFGFVKICDDFKKVSRYRNLVEDMIDKYSLNTVNSMNPSDEKYIEQTDLGDITVMVNSVANKGKSIWGAYIYSNIDFNVNIDALNEAL